MARASNDLCELYRLSSAVAEAMEAANAIAEHRGVCMEFRELTRYAGEMLGEFSDQLTAVAPLEDAEMDEFVAWVERAREHLDSLATMPDRTLH